MLMTTSEPVPADARSGMTADEAAALYRLMTWLSPSFPVGAFSYSSGIEWAVEAGDITDAASLRDWLAAMLTDGSGFCDGVFLAQAHRAASARDDARLREIAELAAAFVPSRERQLETTTQGRAFIEIARAAWACDGLDNMVAACGGAIVYPVAVGLVSAAHAIPLAPTMHAFLHALVSNWISAGARLVPLGQTDSQRILAALEPVVVSTAKRALHRRSTISAAPPFAPISPACATRRSIRGCSGHDGAGHSPSVVPANAGTHNHRCLFCEECRPPQSTVRPRRMGPCVRRDDNRETISHV